GEPAPPVSDRHFEELGRFLFGNSDSATASRHHVLKEERCALSLLEGEVGDRIVAIAPQRTGSRKSEGQRRRLETDPVRKKLGPVPVSRVVESGSALHSERHA